MGNRRLANISPPQQLVNDKGIGIILKPLEVMVLAHSTTVAKSRFLTVFIEGKQPDLTSKGLKLSPPVTNIVNGFSNRRNGFLACAPMNNGYQVS